MAASEIGTNLKQLLVLSCVSIFTSEALCISCFSSLVENDPMWGVKKTAFNLIDNTSTGLEQRSSDAKPMAIA